VQVAAQLAHVVDADLVADGLDDVQIRMHAACDARAFTDQLASEGYRRHPLSHARRSVEQVGVRGTLEEGGTQ